MSRNIVISLPGKGSRCQISAMRMRTENSEECAPGTDLLEIALWWQRTAHDGEPNRDTCHEDALERPDAENGRKRVSRQEESEARSGTRCNAGSENPCPRRAQNTTGVARVFRSAVHPEVGCECDTYDERDRDNDKHVWKTPLARRKSRRPQNASIQLRAVD
jgi:hypothetical protein